jgi:NAD+ synthase (glutamine-hydrolysing)
MKIAIAQINTIVGDLKGNTERAIKDIRRARREHADLIVFPELTTTGYPPKDLLLSHTFVEENKRMLDLISVECKAIACIVGFVDYAPSNQPVNTYDLSSPYYSSKRILYNSAAFASDGKIVGVQHKTKLPNYDVFDERRYFEPANEWPLFELHGTKIAISVCEDIWVDDGPTGRQAKMGADIIITISASPFYVGKTKVRRELLERRTKEAGIPILYVNLVGGQDDLVFDGASCFFNKNGDQTYMCKQFAEDFAVVSGTERKVKISDREPAAEIHDALVLGIRDYVLKNSFKKVILGLSGGIDSSVVACLAADALGRENVMGIIMPSRISSKASADDAEELARNLGIKTSRIPIWDVYDSYMKVLGPDFSGTDPTVAEQNIQARIRGNMMMALSNKFGYLLLTTGNKSEMAVGYVTLYGDLAGGLAPLSDVTKTSVYSLASYINKKAGEKIIPDAVIKKAPSAELKPNQKDSDDLPPYDVLDKILHSYIEENADKHEIIAMGFDKRVVEDVVRRADHSEYKRKQAPIGIKITPKAFGFGRRMPITNKYGT